jgi:O-antigen ligase
MGSIFKGIGLAAKTSQVGYGAQDFQTVHNVLMYFLFKGGLLGTCLALVGLTGILFRGYMLIYTLRVPFERTIARALVAAYGGQLIASLAMPRLTYPIGAVFVSMIAAAFVVLGDQTSAAETNSVELSEQSEIEYT